MSFLQRSHTSFELLLTSICAYSEILANMETEPRERSEFLAIIDQESRRLSSLVDDVIVLSELEAGKLPELSMMTVNLLEVAANNIRMFEHAVKQKFIDVRLESIGTTFGAWTVPRRITQVVARLLDNAVKFTPEHGDIIVTVIDQGEFLLLSVADSGVGVPEAERDTVFEKFRQLGDVMTDKPDGTGLGLAICRDIMLALGGQIECVASPLGGAQFTLTLPSAASVPRRSSQQS